MCNCVQVRSQQTLCSKLTFLYSLDYEVLSIFPCFIIAHGHNIHSKTPKDDTGSSILDAFEVQIRIWQKKVVETISTFFEKLLGHEADGRLNSSKKC